MDTFNKTILIFFSKAETTDRTEERPKRLTTGDIKECTYLR